MVWHTAPRVAGPRTLVLPCGVSVETLAELSAPERVRACRLVWWRTRSGARRAEVHLSVRVDTARAKEQARTDDGALRITGADRGAVEAIALGEGTRIAVPEHPEEVKTVLDAQKAMARCSRGSRGWRRAQGRLQGAHRTIAARDCDTIGKCARRIAREFDVLGMEGLKATPMRASARGGRGIGVAAKRRLNHRIARARWGMWRTALESAFEAEGGCVVEVPAMDSSRGCAACGHLDTASRQRASGLRARAAGAPTTPT